MDIANRLKKARELKGSTQTQVSKETGVNNKTLSGYERGVSEPDLSTLTLLADYYSVSTDFLLGRLDKQEVEEITTIAAHHDGTEYTDKEKEEIESFKEFVKARRNK